MTPHEARIAKARKEKLKETEEMARYWKAEYEVRYYTIEATRLQGAYDEVLNEERRKIQEYREQQQKEIEEQQKRQEGDGTTTPELPGQ